MSKHTGYDYNLKKNEKHSNLKIKGEQRTRKKFFNNFTQESKKWKTELLT